MVFSARCEMRAEGKITTKKLACYTRELEEVE
jgi:hypothetical protein